MSDFLPLSTKCAHVHKTNGHNAIFAQSRLDDEQRQDCTSACKLATRVHAIVQVCLTGCRCTCKVAHMHASTARLHTRMQESEFEWFDVTRPVAPCESQFECHISSPGIADNCNTVVESPSAQSHTRSLQCPDGDGDVDNARVSPR